MKIIELDTQWVSQISKCSQCIYHNDLDNCHNQKCSPGDGRKDNRNVYFVESPRETN